MIYSSFERNRICFVIVLYKELLYDTKTYKSLISKYNIDGYNIGLFIWDNSPWPLHDPPEFKNGVYYKYTGKNEGVSKAYNEAAIYSQSNGYEWMLLLDQDTIFPPLILEEYQKAINENQLVKLFTLKIKTINGKYVSPCIYKHKLSKLSNKSPPVGLLNLSSYSMINSGLLINSEAFLNTGGYNEKVWLDFSDYEFIQRFKNIYRKAYILDKESLQSFSSVEEKDFNSLIRRYKILCECIKNFQKNTIQDKFDNSFLLFKRACSLIIKTGNLSFFLIFRDYFKSRKNFNS
jgi:GT2 family glycosyltransferase